MVERYEKVTSSPVAVVDLDGTLIRGNTLHEFIKLGLRKAFFSADIVSAVKISGLLLLRRLGLVSHRFMKFRCVGAIKIDCRLMEDFRRRMSEMRNERVGVMLEEYVSKGYKILIATAAFGFYVREIAGYPYVATVYEGNSSGEECRGETKLRAVKEWISENGGYIEVVITDHHDDLPLLEANMMGVNIMVDPSDSTLSAVTGSGVPVAAIIRT